MKVVPFQAMACPIDGLPLAPENNQMRCDNGHCFDIAKQRYMHLLPVQDKRSKNPGDSKVMVAARRRFLDTGIYSSISDTLNTLVIDCINASDSRSFAIVDTGCGEGYYLEQLKQTLMYADADKTDTDKVVALHGLDISKPAIHAATQRDRQHVSWSVATNRNLPLQDGSVDLITCMFGYPVFTLFSKRLKQNGCLLLAEAGEQHLIELRQLIYDDVRVTPLPPHNDAMAAGFELKKQTDCQQTSVIVNSEQIHDLLLMTPHFFKAPTKKKAQILALPELRLTIDVAFRLYALNNH